MRHLKVLLFSLIPLFFLTACGNLLLEIDSDGSGQVLVEIEGGGFVSADMIKQQIEKDLAGSEGISKLSVKDKKGIIETKFKFDNLSNVYDDEAFMIPVGDYAVTNHYRLENLTFQGQPVEFTKDSKEIFILLPSLNDFDNTKIVVPGNVVAHSDNVNVLDKNAVTVSSGGDIYIVYEPKASFGGLLGIGVIVLIIAGGAYFLFTRKKSNPTPPESVGEDHA